MDKRGQYRRAELLLVQLEQDGHDHDISTLDLLDSMASMGLSLTVSSASSKAYGEALRREGKAE